MNLASIRRNFFEPIYYWKSRSPKLGYWRKLEKTQYLPQRELEKIQWHRLKKLYSFLWEKNGFYSIRFKEAGLTPNDLKEPADIIKLPILTKKEIRENGNAMISDGFNKSALLHFKTGGSTGKALDIFVTEECSSLRNACTRRHDRWIGWEPGEPIAAVWGNPELPKTLKEKLKNSLIQPFIYLDTMAVNDQSVYDFAYAWLRENPTLLLGHAHSLFLLAQHLDELAIDIVRPVGILSTSMMLLPHERVVIERVLQCKVTDRYGCEEVSLIGSECEQHDGMHMNIEHLVIEFLKDDGSYALSGELGNIVVTDLMNFAMPFVRYQVEDLGIPLGRQCSCGRGLPLMGKVAGRVADFLIKQDGTRVAGISLIENSLTRMPGIDQMQIVQESLGKIELNIVTGKEYSNKVAEDLRDYFKKIFHGAEVIIRKVSMILPETSGKYRFSICHVRGKR